VIRGFAVNSDDIAYNGLYGLLPRQFVASELLERVEVFRGANSFINGAAPGGGGVGGSVNLVPKRAPNADLTQLSFGMEGNGQGYVAADVARRFGPDGRAGVRINAVRRDGATGVDREGRELSVFSIGLDYRERNYRLSADVGYQNHNLTEPRPSVTVGAGIPIPAAPDADSTWAQKWTRSDERDLWGTLRGEVDLAPGTVGWAAFGARKGDETNVLASPTVTTRDGSATMYRFDNIRHDTAQTGELGVRTMLRTGAVGHTISASASGFELKSDNAYATSDFFNGFATNIYRPVDSAAPAADFFTGGSLANPLLTHKTILSSYALADTLSLLDDKLLVTVGVRHQRIKDYGYDYNSGSQISGYDQSANTPVAGIVYKPAKGVSLYANYIEGLQQGAVASGTDIDNVGETFAPYKSRQKEIGVKVEAGKVGMSAALFTTTQPSAFVLNRHFGVFGEQRNRGLELSAWGTPAHGLRVLGGLTLLDAKQESTAGATNEGKDVIGVPDTQLNAGVEWDVPSVQNLRLNARTVYTSHQFADGGNQQRMPSWTRLDLGASYLTHVMGRDVTLRARIDNITNRAYWASAGGFPGAGYLVAGSPRTAVVSATIDF
jgi:iron complex outermembrane receptor protein